MTSEICFSPTKNQVKPVQPSAITASSKVSQGQFAVPFLEWGGKVTLTLHSHSIDVPSSSVLLNVGCWQLSDHSIRSTAALEPLHLFQKEQQLLKSQLLGQSERSARTVCVCVGCIHPRRPELDNVVLFKVLFLLF